MDGRGEFGDGRLRGVHRDEQAHTASVPHAVINAVEAGMEAGGEARERPGALRGRSPFPPLPVTGGEPPDPHPC
ncbi:hypothetical protein GCM10010214_38570 [Streptomyces abikoensis]|nr:hypothetical protein GCM10010214_38570 [Streptomyces abikoensis]